MYLNNSSRISLNLAISNLLLQSRNAFFAAITEWNLETVAIVCFKFRHRLFELLLPKGDFARLHFSVGVSVSARLPGYSDVFKKLLHRKG